MNASHQPLTVNNLGQPIGFPVPNWTPPRIPARQPMAGRHCRLEPLDATAHAHPLFDANSLDTEGRNWTYLAYGPFATFDEYAQWADAASATEDTHFYTIIPHSTGRPSGVASYLRITPDSGSIEVGHLHFSPAIQRSPAATEAMFLMMKRAFELGYRRYEWKCDALNAPSRAAAQRLGLSFEGIFRQATIYKGRNRDTAWYAAIDTDWPPLEQAFTKWLAPDNFDQHGQQRISLRALTKPLLHEFVEAWPE
ncbi:MAG: GNAT family protein [Verrucomicrobiales bacterium]